MALHRDLMRGTGFFGTLLGSDMATPTDRLRSTSIADAPAASHSLPLLNYLDINHERYAKFLVEEALPQDRDRFEAYLSARPLGLALIASPVNLKPLPIMLTY